jgi:hypothetical protein
MFAALAFFAYVLSVLWLHEVQKSTWRVEQEGPLVFAASHLFYDTPFGSIDLGLWEHVKTHVSSRVDLQEEPADAFLTNAAKRKIPSGGVAPTMINGYALGYPIFATAAVFLFGPHTISLLLGFVILMSVSVVAFLSRFRDDRTLAVQILFFALTIMLLGPLATQQVWINQLPLGGYRYFVVAGTLPTVHILFELFDASKPRLTSAPMHRGALPDSSLDESARVRLFLMALQFIVLLYVTAVRLSAMYFVGAITIVALALIWARRHDIPGRRGVIQKIAVLLLVAIIAHFGGRWLTTSSYENTGLGSDNIWHRAFVGLGAHPGWPFGDLATKFDCKPEIPAGMVRGIRDSNSHCAYAYAVKKGAEEGPLFGTQYEKLLRQAFWNVVSEYPRQAIETYLIYKPLLVWQTLLASTRLSISRETAPVLVVLLIQFVMLMIIVRGYAENDRGLRSLCGAFVVISAFSLAPQLVAFSNLATASDVICYMYVALALVLAIAARLMWLRNSYAAYLSK